MPDHELSVLSLLMEMESLASLGKFSKDDLMGTIILNLELVLEDNKWMIKDFSR